MNLMKMLSTKNDQIRELRAQLNKYVTWLGSDYHVISVDR